jgi:hypothetical protein
MSHTHAYSVRFQEFARRSRRATGAVAAALTVALSSISCANGQLSGQSSSFVIIDSLEASSGALPGTFSSTLASDVLTRVRVQGTIVETIFADDGRATFVLGHKDPGAATSPTNFVTITRYHVRFLRADGKNTPGVDVPFAFDGAATGTVSDSGGSLTFTLVRAQSKSETPLPALVGGGGPGAIATIAEVTFFGEDQAGRAVSVTGLISVIFADWGDPD